MVSASLKKVFNILSILLLPITFILIVMVLIILPSVFSSPGNLLSLFVFSAIIIYVFTSFRFYRWGVCSTKTFKPSFKDFIKVNGFVAIAFALISLFQCVTLYNSTSDLQEMRKTLATMAGASTLSSNQIDGLIQVALGFSVSISLILIAHVCCTLYFIKKLAHKFL